MRNVSIFLKEPENGRFYLFGYYEYTGSDIREHMKKLAAEPRNQNGCTRPIPCKSALGGTIVGHDARGLSQPVTEELSANEPRP